MQTNYIAKTSDKWCTLYNLGRGRHDHKVDSVPHHTELTNDQNYPFIHMEHSQLKWNLNTGNSKLKTLVSDSDPFNPEYTKFAIPIKMMWTHIIDNQFVKDHASSLSVTTVVGILLSQKTM